MDNLQKRSDRLAILLTGAALAALAAFFSFDSSSAIETAAEKTAKFQILSIEHEAEAPARGDPEGGAQLEKKEDAVKEINSVPVKKELISEPKISNFKEQKKAAKIRKAEKRALAKKTKKTETEKTSKAALSSVDSDIKGNGNNKGHAQGVLKGKSQGLITRSKAAYDNAFASLLSRISSIKEYPYRAKRQGIEGKCIITFKVNKQGIVSEALLTQKSGQILLDSACKRLGSRLLGFKTGAYGEEVNVQVPVNYRLVD